MLSAQITKEILIRWLEIHVAKCAYTHIQCVMADLQNTKYLPLMIQGFIQCSLVYEMVVPTTFHES